MIKIVYCIRRRPDLSFDQFSQYWSGPHAELVRQHAGILKIARYVQSHAAYPEINQILGSQRNQAVPFDGIAEIYFESVEDMMSPQFSTDAAAAQQAVGADEKNFIDSLNSQMFLSQEMLIVPSES